MGLGEKDTLFVVHSINAKLSTNNWHGHCFKPFFCVGNIFVSRFPFSSLFALCDRVCSSKQFLSSQVSWVWAFGRQPSEKERESLTLDSLWIELRKRRKWKKMIVCCFNSNAIIAFFHCPLYFFGLERRQFMFGSRKNTPTLSKSYSIWEMNSTFSLSLSLSLSYFHLICCTQLSFLLPILVFLSGEK